jgi:hypothetical protein
MFLSHLIWGQTLGKKLNLYHGISGEQLLERMGAMFHNCRAKKKEKKKITLVAKHTLIPMDSRSI